MSSLFSSQDLIDAGRQLEVPFKVSLLLNGKTETAECTQLLRLVPGRRVVVELLIGNTTYLGKIFVGTERTKYCQREQSGIQALQNAGILTAKLEGQGCLADHGAEVLLLEFLLQVQQELNSFMPRACVRVLWGLRLASRGCRMSSLFSSQDLIDAGRQLEVPFKVSLLLNGKTETAECTQLLRLVPGRRVVVELLIGNTTYLGKIFVGTERTKYCQREQSGIQALQNAGILTAKLEGQGCLADHGAEVLLLEFLLQVQHLSELLASQQPDALRQLETAVSVMATLHDSGLLHKDCHLDNFLVNEQGLYLIDGDAVEQTTALTQAGALENLALFFVQLPLLLNHRLAELFAHYCERRGWSQGNTQPAFRQQIQKQRANRQRRFLKKVFRDCTQFKVTKNWSRFVALDRQTDSPELQALIGNPDRYIEAGQLLKDGNSATVAKVKLGDKAYVVKRYNLKSLVHWMARFWRPSRAWASWRNAQLLCFYGIGTPKPVAMLEQRCGALRGKAYFITEHLAADNASK